MADVNASLVKALDGTAPQYKRKGAQAFDPVEGSGGSLHTKIYGSNDEVVSPNNPFSVNLAKNSIEIASESVLELKAGEKYFSPFTKASSNKVNITLTTSSLNVTENITVKINHYNSTTNGSLYTEYLYPTQKLPNNRTGTGRTFEAELVGKYYQVEIINSTSEDSTLNRLYIKEMNGNVDKSTTTVGPRQVMERGQKTYDDSVISLSNRDVIFEITEPFIMEHFYYIYEPKNRNDSEGLENYHTLGIYIKVGDNWVAYSGVATNNVGRINPHPRAIVSEVYNGHFPQYNILQYDTRNAVYAFEINREIKVVEGLQIAVHSSGLEEGGQSVFSYQLRGRTYND